MAEINRDKENNLSHSSLLELLHYCPETGVFTNKLKQAGVAVGKILGTKLANGYISLTVKGPKFLAHRLAWFYIYEVWPKCYIDHIDRCRDNNAIANLREANEYENVHNMKMLCTNTSGYTGVRKLGNRWQARIYFNKKDIYLGCYDTHKEASEVREKYKEDNKLL